tara:strand:+ start:201 stop:1010 length:810 start_codon:yes stop_codon:yes gene_type:complete
MAEILTTTDAPGGPAAPEVITTEDNLSAEEQDSLAVGETLVEQQDTLLAGKYKDAAELEAAYKELEHKLGNKDEDVEVAEPESDSNVSPSVAEATTLINDASSEYWNNGEKLSDATIQKFSGMSSQDLVDAYISMTKNNPQAATGAPVDLSDAQVNQIQNSVGGKQKYTELVTWASNNLSQDQTSAFDNIINSGNTQAIALAVAGLRSEYEAANGYEGRMLTGKAPMSGGDVFRSQQELVTAMNDRRYDNDPAYRQDVIEKLDRSDLQF